jgi:hypothetical protein
MLPSKIGRARIFGGMAGGVLLIGSAGLAADWFIEQQKVTRADAYVESIISLSGLRDIPSFYDRIDKVRTFINDNSIHKIDESFWANHGNLGAYAEEMVAYAKGTSSQPVHMECSSRTNLMARILAKLGYETRIVAIFNSRTNLRSHSFLEVLNPETELWITQDADYDIYWRSRASGERISLADTAEVITEIEPCGRERCGWNHVSREGIKASKLIDYLDIISITEKKKAVRYTMYTTRADLNRIYSKGSQRGSFCEVEAKRCKDGFLSYIANAVGATH